MENLSEIKQRLNAIEQTRQITNAMYLLSVSRMKKSMQNIEYNLEYLRRLRATVKNIISKAKHNEISNPYIELNPNGRTMFLVLTSDKGLCGGYNSDVLHLAFEFIARCNNPVICSLGVMGTEILRNHSIEPDYIFYGASQKPSLHLARNICDKIINAYCNEGINEVYIVYTQYISSTEQKAVCKRVLPLLRRDFSDIDYEYKYIAQPIYEPSVQKVFDDIIPQYIIGTLYDVFMQSATSENCARMAAMQNSVKNADEMIEKLNLEINAARQLAITNEITEIAAATEIEGAV
ncbi:MAG: ATP synthase F1 subunit gamma [Clostridia bacterium]|nr:ATP synthase F1 subunit gamma [Clostridia bacterium]